MAEPPAALIAGAGPVGLALAVNLARHGIRCRIVDKNAEPSAKSKALGVQARTLEVFDVMGVVEEALGRGDKVSGICIHNHEHVVADITLSDLETPYPFALILPQSDTERILMKRLSGLGVEVERNAELTGFSQDGDRVSATIRRSDGAEERCEAAWLFGCDGAHSAVRHGLGLPFEGAPYEEGFALADVKLRWDMPRDRINLFLSEKGLLGVFPMGDLHRLVVSMHPSAVHAEVTLEEMQKLVDERGPGNVRLSDPVWLSAFRIQRRKVPTFRQGRVFVLGDAAHIHSPAGGQGMNTGIQDAFNLAWKVALVCKGAAPETLLDTFTAEREPVAKSVLRMTDWMTHGATLHNAVAQRIRNRIIPALVGFDFARKRFMRQMSEIGINYRKSPIVSNDWAGDGGPVAGDRAPDGELVAPDGRRRRLFELLRDTRHLVLLFDGGEDAPDDITGFIRERFDDVATCFIIREKGEDGAIPGVGTLLDPGGAFHRAYGARGACLFVLRPDGYVGYRAMPPDRERLERWLGRSLLCPAQPVF